jgi:arsenate reductase
LNNKIYYLSTCDTCRRILKELKANEHDFDMQDIKAEPLSASQVDELAVRTGSYEALINKRATLYKERKLAEKSLSEKDYRNLLLEHYTFLKRPVVDYDGQLFVGNDKQTIAAAKKAVGE